MTESTLSGQQTDKQNLLVAVTGESPAVVTETVFALYKECSISIDRIIIITTTRGADQARLQLLVGDEGRPKPLEQLCRDYQLPAIQFKEEDILIVPGENGKDVDDARSEGDQRALADFITQSVRQLTQGDDVRVIASLAGGRKTMTFFLGYAMSLFGRPDDMLTHVLVSDPFEMVEGFYYPTRSPVKLKHRRTGEYSDASKALVTLVQIPIVRMREEMPGSIIYHNHSYTETVDKLNYYYDPRRRKLVVDSHSMTVSMEGKVIPLSPTEYAFYAMFARNAADNTLEERGFNAPRKTDKSGNIDMVYCYLTELLPPEQRSEVDDLQIEEILQRIDDYLQDLRVVNEDGIQRSARSLNDNIRKAIATDCRLSNFADLKRRVTKAIDLKLGERLGQRYHPLQELDEEKNRRKKNSPFRLELAGSCIEMID